MRKPDRIAKGVAIRLGSHRFSNSMIIPYFEQLRIQMRLSKAFRPME
jgi:hypothetical protein